MFGYASPEEMVSSITDINTQIYVDTKKRPELLEATQKQDDWIYAENCYRRKDGSIITANLAIRKVLDSDGKLAYLEGFIEDITERRRIEEAEAVAEWRKEECTVWARSYAGIPIHFMGAVVGFINLYSATAGFFTPAHTERMQTFANQIATVFANSRLVEELQKANARLLAQLSEIQALQNELREQAIRDPLTGVFNRRYLKETLDREIARVHRVSQPVGIMIMDIDNFKLINDTYGHRAGDLILQALGELLKNNIRLEDIACRYGGEEFVVVMPGASLQTANERAEIIRSRFEVLRVAYESWNIHATVSLGVAAYPLHGSNSEEVLIRADRALFRAKQEGRNRVVVYQDTIRSPFTPQEK